MRKLLHIFLSIFIVYASTQSAYANTSLGGWTVTDSVIAGVNTTINATKSSGSTALKSAITVAPNALKVGGFLLRGGAVGALALAIPQLIGEGVDYVLDPANNTVTYFESTSDPLAGTYAYRASYGNSALFYGATPYDAAQALCNSVGSALEGAPSRNDESFYIHYCPALWDSIVIGVGNGKVLVPTSPPVEKSIPIVDVATQVVTNAEAGHVESQETLKTVAIEGFVAGDYDADLEAASVPDTSAGTGTGTGTSTSDPATSDTGILSGILAAITSLSDWVKVQWSEFVLTFTALNDWLFEESPVTNPDNTITPSIPPVVPAQVAIDFVGGCPAPLGFDFDFYGRSYRPAIPFTPICDVAILINPIIKICATIAAAYIVAGIRQGSN